MEVGKLAFPILPPEYHTDPPQIMEMISQVDLVSLQIAKLRTHEAQLQGQLELARQRIEILEKTREKIG